MYARELGRRDVPRGYGRHEYGKSSVQGDFFRFESLSVRQILTAPLPFRSDIIMAYSDRMRLQ